MSLIGNAVPVWTLREYSTRLDSDRECIVSVWTLVGNIVPVWTLVGNVVSFWNLVDNIEYVCTLI